MSMSGLTQKLLFFALIHCFHAHILRPNFAQLFASGVKSPIGVISRYSWVIIISLAVNNQIRWQQMQGGGEQAKTWCQTLTPAWKSQRCADLSASRRLLPFSGLDMKVCFAPADVPLVRRIQTAVVLQWVFSFLALGKCTCFHYFYFQCLCKAIKC